jgi:peroxiredoxin Q/BCP
MMVMTDSSLRTITSIRRLYRVRNTLGLFPGRVTYVIDRDGIVRHVFSSQLGFVNHVKEAL